MVTEPGDTPPTTPPAVTVAIAVLPLDHTPPAVVLDKDVVVPGHKLGTPDRVPACGSGLTVSGNVAKAVPHVLVTVYMIFTEPAVAPPTLPTASTVALVVLLLLHTPPGAALLSDIVDASHTAVGPVIVPANGSGLTVTAWVAVSVPQLNVYDE